MKTTRTIKLAFDEKLIGMIKAVEYICLKEGVNPYEECFKGIEGMTKGQQITLVLSTYKKLVSMYN